jgi:hypothetical protein
MDQWNQSAGIGCKKSIDFEHPLQPEASKQGQAQQAERNRKINIGKII